MEKWIFVNITGGVMGFTPDEIEKCNKSFKSCGLDDSEYWNHFNHFFSGDLNGKRAKSYSVIWN